MKKKWIPFIIITWLLLFVFQWINAVDEMTKPQREITKTHDISLTEFVSKYENNDFTWVLLKWETDLFGLVSTTGKKQSSFMVLPNIPKDYYIAYVAKKPKIESLTELWIVLTTTWNKSVPFFESQDKEFNIVAFAVENILPFVIWIFIIMLVFKFMWPKWWSWFSPFGINIGKLNNKKESTTKFSDIAGMDEVKAELEEIIDFLKNPKKYNDVWARPPKWILLYWVPWSGKTLLAKAVAGEANASFFSTSWSEFMEMLVGMWAAKVRELFGKAKIATPSIIFIDEIDAIGKRRWNWHSGWHQEQEQTLNQILTEMDWFSPSTNVIVIAATNRPDTLDPALMRSWRFDRKIMVWTPTLEERKAILTYYLKDKKVDPKLSIDDISRRTGWFVWADLENMVNEASLKIAKDDRKILNEWDFEYALEKIVMWPEKKIKSMNDKERKIIAYHELGHAITANILPESDPVEKISIVSRWRALWVTWTMPVEDSYLTSKSKFHDELVKLVAWRAAEDVFFGEENVTTWASNDFERATAISRDMILKYGMDDELGQVCYLDSEQDDYNWHFRRYSDETSRLADQKIKKLIADAYIKAKKILHSNEALIHIMAEILLEKEYLTKEEFDEIVIDIKKAEKMLSELKDNKVKKKKVLKKTVEDKKTVKKTTKK